MVSITQPTIGMTRAWASVNLRRERIILEQAPGAISLSLATVMVHDAAPLRCQHGVSSPYLLMESASLATYSNGSKGGRTRYRREVV